MIFEVMFVIESFPDLGIVRPSLKKNNDIFAGMISFQKVLKRFA